LHLAVVGALAVRVRGHGGNTAVVVAVARHPDVTVHAPIGTPRVLDDPVIAAARGAVTDAQDTMIEGSARASGFVVNTAGIELEGLLRSIDGNADGTNVGRSGLESSLRARGDVGVGGKGGTTVGGIVLAITVFGGVGVAGFGVDTMVGDDVGEGIIHKTTVATIVTLGRRAVDEVLLGERNEGTGVDGMSTFDGASGGERPARTALTLVLYAGNDALLSPIDGSGESGGLDFDFNSFGNGDGFQTLEDRGEFGVAQVAELVHGDGEADVLLVEFGNEVEVLFPDGITTLEFLGGVNLGVVTHPLVEDELSLTLLRGSS